MKKYIWIIAAVVLGLVTEGFTQSKLSRQIQEKLSQRKATQTKQSGAASASNKTSTPAPEKVAATTPQGFTSALDLAIQSKDLGKFNGLISWKTIAVRATRDLSDEVKTEFTKSLLEETRGKASIGARIINTVTSGGSYKLLGLRKSGKTVVALYRMILPGSRGVNYHEYSLARTQSGNVVAADLYVYLTGEKLSDSMRRNLVASFTEETKAKKAGLKGIDMHFATHLKTVTEITKALSDKDAEKARTLILSLPKEMRSDKAIQTLTLNTYRNSRAFETVLKQIRTANPDDVFMDMLAIDAFAGQKKFDSAADSIDRLSKRVGKDPYLMVLKGRMLLRKGDRASARKLIEAAISLDDTMLSGYWNLVSFSLKEKNHAETLRLLKLIDRKFKIKFRDLREIATYKDFVKSVEFKEWQKHIDANTAPGETRSSRKKATGAPAQSR